MVGQRVVARRRVGPGRRRRRRPATSGQRVPLALVERGDVEPERTGRAGRAATGRRRARRRRPGAATQRPSVGGRRSPVSASSSSTSTQPRSATTRSTASGRRSGLRTPGGPARRRAPRRRRRSRLGPTLAQHVAVAGEQRQRAWRGGAGPAHRRRAAIACRAEDAEPDRVLARADVGDVGAPPGDRRGRGRRARAAWRRTAWSAASGRAATTASPRTTSACSTPDEVERDPVARARSRRPCGRGVWIARTRTGRVAGPDDDAGRRRRRRRR